MENRFGIKDAFLFGAMAIIAILIGLSIKAYDRQWNEIQVLKTQTSALATDLTTIRSLVAQGAIAPTTQRASQSGADSFKPLREAEAQPDFARGDWFVENFGTNIGKLTPLISTDVYAAWVQAKVQETLAYRDLDSLKFLPLLATDWEVSPDGKTMAFNLRRGVVFSDGHPMTAADVVFTFDWIMNPAVDAPRSRAYLSHMTSVTAEGDYRVVFTFKEFIFNTFEAIATTGIMPRHFYEKYKPQAYNENPGLLMGTGAYRLPSPTDWRPGVRVELVRNERYWGVPGTVDRFVYYEVKDDVAEETMYRNREIDRLAATPDAFEKLKNDKSITDRSSQWNYYSTVSGYTYIGWNQKRSGKATMFADKRVRQAMTMLIDRGGLVSSIYYGHAKAATGPFGFGSPQTDPEIKPWPYDPGRARALLKEAGFEDRNRDGIIENADGQPLKFALTYPAGNPFTDRIVLFIKDGLAKAGVQCDLDAVDWPIMLKKLENRDFEASTLGWSTSVETDCNQIFHSSQTKDNGDNVINYVSAEADTAIDKARSTVDEQQRMEAWRAVHRIIHEDQPYTFLLNRQGMVFIDSRFKNIRESKLGLNVVNTELSPFVWYVPQGQQLHKN